MTKAGFFDKRPRLSSKFDTVPGGYGRCRPKLVIHRLLRDRRSGRLPLLGADGFAPTPAAKAMLVPSRKRTLGRHVRSIDMC
jgi:hypothetical protein